MRTKREHSQSSSQNIYNKTFLQTVQLNSYTVFGFAQCAKTQCDATQRTVHIMGFAKCKSAVGSVFGLFAPSRWPLSSPCEGLCSCTLLKRPPRKVIQSARCRFTSGCSNIKQLHRHRINYICAKTRRSNHWQRFTFALASGRANDLFIGKAVSALYTNAHASVPLYISPPSSTSKHSILRIRRIRTAKVLRALLRKRDMSTRFRAFSRPR